VSSTWWSLRVGVVSEIHFAATWCTSVLENGRGRLSIHLLGVLFALSFVFCVRILPIHGARFYRLDVLKVCTYVHVLNINSIVPRVTTLITHARYSP